MAAIPFPLLATKPNNEEEEEDLDKEKRADIDDMISSLPKCKGWASPYLYLYQGFWYSLFRLQGTIFAQQNFNLRPTDILLASHPKCGTTWLKSLAFAIQDRLTRKHQHNNPLLTCNSHLLIPSLEFGLFRKYNSPRELENLPSPRILSAHIPFASLPESIGDSGCRVLCREPKDMFVSMWHFAGKLKGQEEPGISLEEAFELFCRGMSPFGPYWDHVLGYYKASLEWPERFIFFKYEEMQSDSLNHVKRLAEFMGYPFSLEEESKGAVEEIIEICSFENLRSLEVNRNGSLFGIMRNENFFRKGKVGDSNNYLTAEMVHRLDQITKQKFQGLAIGY